MSEQTTLPHPVKAKHRAMWAMGDYDRVSTEVIPELGTAIVAAAGIRAGQRVLDVAAGSGNASLPAAAAGADVVATDLTPELVGVGADRSVERGLAITWREADAEHLPFGDAEFDVTMSCVGVMFAPFHQPVADELVRVTRPGGHVAVLNWTPTGFIGELFTVMKPFLPAPPEGATPGPRWGVEQHVRELFGDAVDEVRAEVATVHVTTFASAREFREYFARNYGPTIVAYRGIADDPDRTAELDAAIEALAERYGAGTGAMDWEYLVVVARRAGAGTGAG